MTLNQEIHNKKWGSSIALYGKWYLFSSLITKGLGIILLPIYTQYLSPTDYGILQTLNSIAAFLPFVISLSLDSAFGRYYHEDKYDKTRLINLFSTVYWFVLAYGILILFVIILLSPLWVEDLITVPVFPFIYITIIPVLFNQLALLGRTFLQQALETKKSTLLDITSTLLNASISVILLVIFDMGVISRLIGIAVGALFLFVFYHFYFLHIGILKYTFSKSDLNKCLKYSLPMLPAMAGSWISSMSDRLVIAKYCSLASVGLYSLAFQLSQILYLIGDAITRVVGPLIMSGLISDKENTKNKIISSSFQIFVLMLFANICLFIFSNDIINIFANKAYYEAAVFIPLLGFNYVIGMQQRFPTTIISFKKKTWIISLGCILMALINLCLNLLFVPSYGYEFSVYASVAANISYCIWSFIWSNKFERISFMWNKYILAFLLFILLLAFYFYFLYNHTKGGLFSFLQKLLYVLVCAFVLFKYSGLYKFKINVMSR